MAEYRNGSHTVYDIKYHFVWITKYRYKVLKGNVALKVRDLLKQGCDAKGLKIIKGSVGPDMSTCSCHARQTLRRARSCSI